MSRLLDALTPQTVDNIGSMIVVLTVFVGICAVISAIGNAMSRHDA